MFGMLMKSWLLGHVVAAAIALPMVAAFQPSNTGMFFDQIAARGLAFAAMIPTGFLISFTLGFMFSLPLLLIGATGAFLFRPWIIRFRACSRSSPAS